MMRTLCLLPTDEAKQSGERFFEGLSTTLPDTFSLAELAYQIGNVTLNSYPSLVLLNFAKLVKTKAFYHTALKQAYSKPQPGEARHL